MITTAVFIILMVAVFGRLIGAAIKMTWGIAKVITVLVLLPFMLVGAVLKGLINIAIPVLVVIGIMSLFTTNTQK